MTRIFIAFMLIVWGMTFRLSAANPDEEKGQSIYIFGLAGGLADTVVYMTDVQEMEHAQLQKRTGFLLGRADYSTQLKTYLTQMGFPNQLCIVYFSKKRSKLEKKYARLRKDFENDVTTEFNAIPSKDFMFQPLGEILDSKAPMEDKIPERETHL